MIEASHSSLERSAGFDSTRGQKPPETADAVGLWLNQVVIGWLPDAGIDAKHWVEQPVSPDGDVRTFPASVIEVLPVDNSQV